MPLATTRSQSSHACALEHAQSRASSCMRALDTIRHFGNAKRFWRGGKRGRTSGKTRPICEGVRGVGLSPTGRKGRTKNPIALAGKGRAGS